MFSLLLPWSIVVMGGCSEDRLELLVDLRTDLTLGSEFASVSVQLQRQGERGSANRSLELPSDAAVLDGIRIAEFADLKAGGYDLLVTLLDAEGAEVINRPVQLDLEESFAVTVLITRDCRGVECPNEACLVAACVSPGCTPETPELCPTMCDPNGGIPCCVEPPLGCMRLGCLLGRCSCSPLAVPYLAGSACATAEMDGGAEDAEADAAASSITCVQGSADVLPVDSAPRTHLDLVATGSRLAVLFGSSVGLTGVEGEVGGLSDATATELAPAFLGAGRVVVNRSEATPTYIFAHANPTMLDVGVWQPPSPPATESWGYGLFALASEADPTRRSLLLYDFDLRVYPQECDLACPTIPSLASEWGGLTATAEHSVAGMDALWVASQGSYAIATAEQSEPGDAGHVWLRRLQPDGTLLRQMDLLDVGRVSLDPFFHNVRVARVPESDGADWLVVVYRRLASTMIARDATVVVVDPTGAVAGRVHAPLGEARSIAVARGAPGMFGIVTLSSADQLHFRLRRLADMAVVNEVLFERWAGERTIALIADPAALGGFYLAHTPTGGGPVIVVPIGCTP